jgi:hypothetical protein
LVTINWLLHHDNVPSHTSFPTREFLTKSNITVLPTPYFSLFPRLKIKKKIRHFDTIKLMEAESQALLNTLETVYTPGSGQLQG